MKHILFLCTGNSCRSILAEAYVNHQYKNVWQAHSAGSTPTGAVHPMALDVIKGRDISVDGPIDVLGNTKSAVMDNDLKKACESALHISRKSARKYAENFSWQSATEIFASHLETHLKNSTAPRPKKSSENKIDYKVSAQS